MSEAAQRAVRAWLLLLCGYLGLGAALLLVGLDLGRTLAEQAAGQRALDAAVGLAATVLAALVLTWFTALTALALHLPRRVLWFGRSGLLARRLAALLLGLGLSGTLTPALAYAAEPPAVPAVSQLAGAGGQNSRWAPDRPSTADLSGWTPDRPATPATPKGDVALVVAAPRAQAGSGGDELDLVVVRRGDTLWDITARHLGPGAGAREIAAEWPRWYAANRAQIGANPDLIVPGTRLRPPATTR